MKYLRKYSDFLITIGILAAATLLAMLLSGVNDDNNPFAMGIFILSVALIARFTSGYLWGIFASLVGTFFVNYIFTYPFWVFDLTYPGYPLTAAVMLIVSIIISTLTTQIKRQEQLKFEIEREKMHANLLRAIAHDLRTPLAAIIGASSALLDQNLSQDDQRDLATGIQQDAQWLVRVTENLLSITRFSGEGALLKKEDQVLEEIIGSAILKYHQSPHSLPVQVDTPDSILVAPVDPVLIEQVLINLFDNVSAHAVTATRIWIHIHSSPDHVTLSVEDDGVGIPASLLPSIFDGSSHISSRKRADDRRSMGIGLSVCRSIIQAHGGEMRAGPSAHGGAAFTFDLPCEEEDYGQQPALENSDR